MKFIAYNEKQLDVAVQDMYNKIQEFGQLQLEYQKPYKKKTLRQLGFFFGGLVDSVIDFFHQQGIDYTVDNVKNNFYEAVSYKDDSFKVICKHFNGKDYAVPKTLSQMDREEASRFIDICLWLIDHAKCFDGLILHPSLRYTWINHITKDDVDSLRFCQFPREDKEYLSFQRKQACLCCGRANCSQVHHLKEIKFTGTGYKADDWLAIPLCADCHLKGYHEGGKETFMNNLSWITKKLSMVDFCRINYNKWRYKE